MAAPARTALWRNNIDYRLREMEMKLRELQWRRLERKHEDEPDEGQGI